MAESVVHLHIEDLDLFKFLVEKVVAFLEELEGEWLPPDAVAARDELLRIVGGLGGLEKPAGDFG